jgi:type IV secretory pathway TrbL component
MDVMADGCVCLAHLWECAWKEGNGDANITKLGAISETTLENIYQNSDFMPSHTLDTIGSVLTGKASGGTSKKSAKTGNSGGKGAAKSAKAKKSASARKPAHAKR